LHRQASLTYGGDMTTPDDLERQHTLLTAAKRYDHLRTIDALANAAADLVGSDSPAPSREESLEMLALGEVLARKAAYGRQLGVRRARSAGATWSQIGAALGTTKQSAWEAHMRWIEEQAAVHGASGYAGYDQADVDEARRVAGEPED
jgi:hypothetical protein